MRHGSLCAFILHCVPSVQVFDFDAIKQFVSRPDFKMTYDALYAITAAYATPLFLDELGCDPAILRQCEAMEDFNGGHPDPNLTYAKELVDIMWADDGPAFGAASDGDGDRNMILGNKFFITPSDSVAMIAANAQVLPLPCLAACLTRIGHLSRMIHVSFPQVLCGS